MKKILLIAVVLLSSATCSYGDWESFKMSLNPNYQKVEEKTTTKYEKRPEMRPVEQKVSKKYETKKDGSKVTIKERYTTKE